MLYHNFNGTNDTPKCQFIDTNQTHVWSVIGSSTPGGKHFIVCTWNHTTGDAQLYEDGVLNQTLNNASAGALKGGNSKLYIGKGVGTDSPAKGSIDEAFLTNTVLSSSTISSLWNNGLGAEICNWDGCAGSNILSGTITGSTTWSLANSPYVVTSTVTIATGTTVTVQRGAIVKFKNDTSLIVNGTLDVQGTSSSLAYFTSYKDDGVGGDTNGDGTSSATSSDWGHIVINSGASTTLSGVVVRYGGSNASSSANVYNNGGTLSVSYADVSYSGHNGIRVASGTTTVTEAQIHNNIVGIDVESGQATVASSTIFGNSGYGAFQAGSPTSTMTGNFWGGWQPLDSYGSGYNSGPYNAATNPYGVGDQVSSYVGYDPYTTSTAYLISPLLYPHPSAVNETGIHPRAIHVGSSTQYQSDLDYGIQLWNNSSTGYVTIFDASSTASSTWDMYVAEINNTSTIVSGEYVATATPPYIYFNQAKIGAPTGDDARCIAAHELGHALGLDHDPSGDMMTQGQCFWLTPNLTLGTRDLQDFNLLWSYDYFWDPYKLKGLIKW